MKKEELQNYKPGVTRICLHSDKSKKGTLLVVPCPTHANLAAVEWDDGTLEKIAYSELKVYTTLEQEFETAQLTISKKLAESAQLLSDAATMAHKYGKGLEDYDPETDDQYFPEVNDIFTSLRKAGWSTSSMRC